MIEHAEDTTTGTQPPRDASARPLRERQREEREELILRAAEEILLERGYHATVMDDIAARVGISKGTVYLHFASKEDLVLALAERGMRAFLRSLDAILSSPASAREKLRAIIERVYGSMSGQRSHLLAAMLQSPELLCRMAEKRRALAALWDEPVRRVSALLDEGKAAGEFDPSLPTPVMMSLFSSLLTPQSFHRLVTEEHMPPDEVAGYLSHYFFNGIAAHETPTRGEDAR